MRVFTLDPSITAVGWCAADVDGRKIEVIHVGKIVSPGEGSTVERTHALIDELRQVSFDRGIEVRPNEPCKLEVVIEIPSGRINPRHQGGGYGLAKYGFAVGSIHQMFEVLWGRDVVHGVEETVWTGSRSKKARREIALQHYDVLKRLKDPGMDISDAVALAVWWAQVGRHKRKGADA